MSTFKETPSVILCRHHPHHFVTLSTTPTKALHRKQPNLHTCITFYRTSSCVPTILIFDHIYFWGFPEPSRGFSSSTKEVGGIGDGTHI